MKSLRSLLTERTFWLILLLALATRTFGFFSPWTTKDHYNFGGPSLSRFVFCIKNSSWKDSRWNIHTGCPAENDITLSPLFSSLDEAHQKKASEFPKPDLSAPANRSYYLNHPPLYPWLLTLSSIALGEHEWSMRLVTLIFSMANVILIGTLALSATGSLSTALLASLLQAGFLGSTYFGTHVDFQSEIIGTFVLLASFAAIANRWRTSYAMAFIAASLDWVGLLVVPALALLSFIREKGRLVSVIALALCPVFVFAAASYVIGPNEVIELFRNRLMHSPHGEQIRTLNEALLFPLHFVKTIFVHHIRLLGPVFFAVGLMALIEGFKKMKSLKWNDLRRVLKERDDLAIITVLGTTTLILITIGPSYVMVHPFFLIPTLSAWALLIATRAKTLTPNRWRDFTLVLITAAFYPFGIHRSTLTIDMTANVLLVASALTALTLAYKRRPVLALATIALTLAGNFAEVINYRTEPPVDRDFCLQALTTYIETKTPISLGQDPSFSRHYYCRGIPTNN